MPPVYSTRFLAQHDINVATPAQYTVPVGKLAILRDIDSYHGGLVGNILYATLASSPAVVFFQASWAINEQGWRPWRGRQVFYAGDTISLFSNHNLDVYASGYLFDV